MNKSLPPLQMGQSSVTKPEIRIKKELPVFKILTVVLVCFIIAFAAFLAYTLITRQSEISKIFGTEPSSYSVSYPVSYVSTKSEPKWTTSNFGTDTNKLSIFYPENWSITKVSDSEVEIGGDFNDNIYKLKFYYPDLSKSDTFENIDAWINSEISFLTLDEKKVVSISKINLKNNEARLISNLPDSSKTYSKMYIWKSESRAQSVLEFKFIKGNFDQAELNNLMSQFINNLSLN